MFFFPEFEEFDPVSGDVPPHPFSNMPAIAVRARALLTRHKYFESDGETKERAISIAKRIIYEICQYFDDIKYMEIERLREQAGLLESMGGDPEWPPNEDDLDIQTWENTSEVDALKTIIDHRDTNLFLPKGAPEPKPNEYPEGKDYELFAVLSLWLLADAQRFLNRTVVGLSIAGDYALKAMDAVGYAEHLHEAEWLVSYAGKQGEDKLTEALKEQQSENQRQRSEKLKQLNVARHKKTKEAKAMVVDEFIKDRYKFPSAEKAGSHFAAWLEKQGILNSVTKQPYEARTVADWIRTHAKEIGLRFR